MRIKKTINAVHDNELAEYMERLGLKRRLDLGELKCKFCRDPITLDTVNSIFPESGSIKLSCDKPQCVLALAQYLTEHEFGE